jgi:hypothetical protein
MRKVCDLNRKPNATILSVIINFCWMFTFCKVSKYICIIFLLSWHDLCRMLSCMSHRKWHDLCRMLSCMSHRNPTSIHCDPLSLYIASAFFSVHYILIHIVLLLQKWTVKFNRHSIIHFNKEEHAIIMVKWLSLSLSEIYNHKSQSQQIQVFKFKSDINPKACVSLIKFSFLGKEGLLKRE